MPNANITDIYFVTASPTQYIPTLDVQKHFALDFKADVVTTQNVFNCVQFIGVAALSRTAGMNISATIPNVLYIDECKLEEVLSEFNINQQLSSLCHKYLVGTFQLIQVNKMDLIQLL